MRSADVGSEEPRKIAGVAALSYHQRPAVEAPVVASVEEQDCGVVSMP